MHRHSPFAPYLAHERAAQADGSRRASATGNVLVIGSLLLFPIVVALLMRRMTFDVASTIVWQFVFSGFGEEIYCRGYIQSRINQEFGRPYQAFGTHFGPGLIIASLYFGLSHALNLFHLFAGRYGFALWWGVWTCFLGLGHRVRKGRKPPRAWRCAWTARCGGGSTGARLWLESLIRQFDLKRVSCCPINAL